MTGVRGRAGTPAKRARATNRNLRVGGGAQEGAQELLLGPGAQGAGATVGHITDLLRGLVETLSILSPGSLRL
jgi:hypothetical protein